AVPLSRRQLGRHALDLPGPLLAEPARLRRERPGLVVVEPREPQRDARVGLDRTGQGAVSDAQRGRARLVDGQLERPGVVGPALAGGSWPGGAGGAARL